MKPLRPRYKKIDREVESLLAHAGAKNPPIPVEDIAASLGAQITYSNFKNEVSGLLIRHKNSIMIGVHSKQTPARKRFTIAHEIGHLIMHEPDPNQHVHIDKLFQVHLRSKTSSTAEDVAEIEANAFAASLLMPRQMLWDDVDENLLDFEDPKLVRSLAEKYQVSTQAMTFRLLNLFPHRTATA